MAVTVRVEVPVLGYAAGEVLEDIERTPRVAGAIRHGYLEVLHDSDPDPFPGRPAVDTPLPDVVPAAAELAPTDTAAEAELSAAVAVVPPRTGKGSGASVWRAFLTAQGVEVPADTDRDGLVAVWDAEAARRGL